MSTRYWCDGSRDPKPASKPRYKLLFVNRCKALVSFSLGPTKGIRLKDGGVMVVELLSGSAVNA